MLEGKQYFVTVDEASVVDIVFYNELTSIFMIYAVNRIKTIMRQNGNLKRWIENLSNVNELMEMDDKLLNVI